MQLIGHLECGRELCGREEQCTIGRAFRVGEGAVW